jgi:apolipoprotein N-acyltransferase
MKSPWLSARWSLLIAAAGVASFFVAYEVEAAGAAIIGYLACLYWLAWAPSPRWAFYLGLAIGSTVAAGQLWFFHDLFGWAAAGLWAILGLWIALYLLLSRIVVARWPRCGALWLPVIWFALEYTRGELYFLRFAWLTPGFALSHPTLVPLTSAGMYGFSFFVLGALALVHTILRPRAAALATLLAPAIFFAPPQAAPETGPLVVGIQLEGPHEYEVLAALNDALQEQPDLDLIVLSEYCFDGPVPQSICDWCAEHHKHLVAGGKEHLAGSHQFYDTAFVVSPTGEIVFSQAKAVPIQFFNDGLPAQEQRVWNSPWGKIGIAICYDLSYSRVIDRLVDKGGQALVIPTMDPEEWGAHEHRLHARVAPVRAREYGIPIFRLGSSGISQLVDRHGRVIAVAPFPGQGARLAGRLPMTAPGALPADRYLALPAVVAVGLLASYLAWCRWHESASTRFASMTSRGTSTHASA